MKRSRWLRRSSRDVVVMDFALPSMNGAVATRRISALSPSTAVLILSMHEEATYVRTCLEAGARGYLLKNAMDLELVSAVKQGGGGRARARSAARPSGGRKRTRRPRSPRANSRCCS